MNCAHYVLIRFNLKSSFSIDKYLNEEWLRKRVALFKAYTFPSLLGQIIQPAQSFQLLLLCHPNSPKWFLDELEVAIKPLQGKILLIDQLQTDLGVYLSNNKKPDQNQIITTRIDSDDAVHPAYLATVQEIALKKATNQELLINFTNGVQFCEGKAFRIYQESNAFISLVEAYTKKPKTVFYNRHPKMKNHFQVVNDALWPAFLQHIHSDNISNEISGFAINLSDEEKAFFPHLQFKNHGKLLVMWQKFKFQYKYRKHFK